jgi:hypothetical protein
VLSTGLRPGNVVREAGVRADDPQCRPFHQFERGVPPDPLVLLCVQPVCADPCSGRWRSASCRPLVVLTELDR